MSTGECYNRKTRQPNGLSFTHQNWTIECLRILQKTWSWTVGKNVISCIKSIRAYDVRLSCRKGNWASRSALSAKVETTISSHFCRENIIWMISNWIRVIYRCTYQLVIIVWIWQWQRNIRIHFYHFSECFGTQQLPIIIIIIIKRKL